MRTRVAPTPSGYIHLGNAFNFKLIEEYAKKNGATLILRIDDFDKERVKDDYINDIFESLEWLKIKIDEGPKDIHDFKRNYSIQLKQEKYWKIADALYKQSRAYACTCSRSQKEKFLETGAYKGSCREKNIPFENKKAALRLKCSTPPTELWQASLNDFVIWTKEGLAAYQLMSVIEDTELRIDTIIRGEDLADSSKAQQFLSRVVGGDIESSFKKIKFFHHALLVEKDGTGRKYSKSEGAHSLKNMIKEGYSYEDFLKDFASFKKEISFI